MARVLEGFHSVFYLHSAHPAFIRNGINHTCLFLPSRSWSSFTDLGGMEGWVGLGGWLHTEINVRHWRNWTRTRAPISVLTGPDVCFVDRDQHATASDCHRMVQSIFWYLELFRQDSWVWRT